MTKYRTVFAMLAGYAAIALIMPCVVDAQVVSEKVRQDRIDAISKVLDAPKPDIDALVGNLRDPFVVGVLSEGHVIQGNGADKSKKGGASDVDMPKNILREAAGMMCPAGLMVVGTKKFVMTVDGSIHPVGETFTLQLGHGPADVTLDDASASNFILRYKNETMTINYDQSIEPEGSATKASASPGAKAR